MLADIVPLFPLSQQLEVQFEVARHVPFTRLNTALLHKVRLQALVVLVVLHGVYLSKLLTEDCQHLVCYSLAKLLT